MLGVCDLSFFLPSSGSSGFSAIVKVSEQIGAAKIQSVWPKFSRLPGTNSQARFPRTSSETRFPSTGSQAQVPKQGFQQARLPRTVPKYSQEQVSEEQVSKQSCQEQAPKESSFQARFPGTGFQARVPKNHFLSKVYFVPTMTCALFKICVSATLLYFHFLCVKLACF